MHSTFEPWFFAWAKPFTGYVVLQAALTLYLHPLSLRAQVFLCKVRVSAATRAAAARWGRAHGCAEGAPRGSLDTDGRQPLQRRSGHLGTQ